LADYYYEDEMPEPEVTNNWGAGTGRNCAKITPNCINRFRKNGQIMMAWVDAEVTHKETPELWEQQYKLGIDTLCTDFPLEAAKVIKQLQQK